MVSSPSSHPFPSSHQYHPFQTGLYTFIVMKDDCFSANQPLLYKQVFSETTFTIDCITGDCPLSIYLIHNQWIGLDEEIHLFQRLLDAQGHAGIVDILRSQSKMDEFLCACGETV